MFLARISHCAYDYHITAPIPADLPIRVWHPSIKTPLQGGGRGVVSCGVGVWLLFLVLDFGDQITLGPCQRASAEYEYVPKRRPITCDESRNQEIKEKEKSKKNPCNSAGTKPTCLGTNGSEGSIIPTLMHAEARVTKQHSQGRSTIRAAQSLQLISTDGGGFRTLWQLPHVKKPAATRPVPHAPLQPLM